MSVWGDLRKRSSGEVLSREDIGVFYYDNESTKKSIETIEENKYKSFTYSIITFGDYPILDIRTEGYGLSVFSSYNLVILKFPDGERYELDRSIIDEKITKYQYDFNKDGDYINSEHNDGHKYTVKEVRQYAEKFIDKIIQCEEESIKHSNMSALTTCD